MDIPQNKQYFTIQEIADLFTVDHFTVRAWINKGFIKSIKVGPRLIRIPKKDLLTFIKEHTRQEDINEII